MKHSIKIKRAYDEPEDGDGARYLVDRLWPRGVTKASLKIDGWLKDIAPSQALRRWFNHDPQRWTEFRQKYFDELNGNPEAWIPLAEASKKGPITLVYSAHDTEHNNAVALAEYLSRQQTKNDHKKER